MRKRSGAIDSNNLETYVKQANLPQNKESLYFCNDYLMVENYEMIEEDSLKRTTSRKWSENTATRPNNKTQMITAASSSVKFRKNTNFEYISSNSGKKPEEKELNLCRIPSFLSSEEQNIKSKNIITKQIIVIGTSQTGKKSLINSMFEEKIDELFQANELMQNGPCFDLIVKNENLGDEKLIYKFWIQNLSNEIYDKIIDVYYKTMNLFIFVYNVCDRGSYRKVEEQYDHIKEISKNGSLNCLLIGMHFSPKFKIEVTYEEANKFAEKMNFSGFLVTNKKNSAVNKNIYEIIKNHFGIYTDTKEET